MKRSKIYPFLLSALLLAACSDEEPSPTPAPGGEEAFATVSVAVDGVAKTKTETKTEKGIPEEDEIYDLNVVFIDMAKNEVAGHAYREIDNNQDTVRVGLKTGTYRLLVIANAGNISSFTPKDYYDKIISLAGQVGESAGRVGTKGLVMSNIARDVTIGKTTENGGINKISETVKRVVGRVDFSALSVDWADKDLKGMEFQLSQVFLANVRPQSYLYDTKTKSNADSDWDLPDGESHTMEIVEESYLCGIKDYFQGGEIVAGNAPANYLKKDTSVTVTETESESAHINIASFYAMTNSCNTDGTAPVILYLKGSIVDAADNPVLTDRYYRIKLANGVQRNTLYQISATIQGKGSPEPGDNKENIDLSVIIRVKTWEGVTLNTITINEEIEIE